MNPRHHHNVGSGIICGICQTCMHVEARHNKAD